MDSSLKNKIVLIYLKDRLSGGVTKKEGRCIDTDASFIHMKDQQGNIFSFPICNVIQVVTKFE